MRTLTAIALLLGMVGAAGAQSCWPLGCSRTEPIPNAPLPGANDWKFEAVPAVNYPATPITNGISFSAPSPDGPVNDDFKRGACWAMHALYPETWHSSTTFSANAQIECKQIGLKN